MTNKIDILYPRKRDFYENSIFEDTIIFTHFCYFGSQITVKKTGSRFQVLSMNWLPQGFNCIDYTKEWQKLFESTDFYACQFKFQSYVKKLLVEQNEAYLSKVYKSPNRPPEEKQLMMELFE